MKMRDELAEKHEKQIEDLNSKYLSENENREPLRYTDYLQDDFIEGFDACECRYFPMIEKLESALKFYSLKSNYSVIDEGRNYDINYKTEGLCLTF